MFSIRFLSHKTKTIFFSAFYRVLLLTSEKVIIRLVHVEAKHLKKKTISMQ